MPDTGSPRPSFQFAVTIGDAPASESASFQEVSGIGEDVANMDVPEGGENRFVHELPRGVRHARLVLKRGIVQRDSELSRWCVEVLEGGLSAPVRTKRLLVSLRDDQGQALRSWAFADAYPVRWHVSAGPATTDVIIEVAEFAYA